MNYAHLLPLLNGRKTDAEIAAYFAESVSVPSSRGRLTHTWVADNISLAAADGIYNAINVVSPPSALRYVTGNGIDTSAALWKQQAEAVAASNASLAPLLPALRDFELAIMPRWQVVGTSEAPTAESVREVIETEKLRVIKSQLEDDATDRLQTYREALSSWYGSGDEPVL